jgi:hypothetical protein
MFWRSSLRSVLAVGAVALVLALSGAHVLDALCAQCLESLRARTSSIGSVLRGGVDTVVSAAPPARAAGPPCAVVATGGEIIGLDSEGYVTSCDTASSRCDLPILTGFVPATKRAGERVSSAEVVLGLEIIRAFEESQDVISILSEVNLGDLANPTAILTGAVKVSLGRGDYRCKVAKLGRVLAGLDRLNCTPRTIDLRFARQAVVTCNEPKKPAKKEV